MVVAHITQYLQAFLFELSCLVIECLISGCHAKAPKTQRSLVFVLDRPTQAQGFLKHTGCRYVAGSSHFKSAIVPKDEGTQTRISQFCCDFMRLLEGANDIRRSI